MRLTDFVQISPLSAAPEKAGRFSPSPHQGFQPTLLRFKALGSAITLVPRPADVEVSREDLLCVGFCQIRGCFRSSRPRQLVLSIFLGLIICSKRYNFFHESYLQRAAELRNAESQKARGQGLARCHRLAVTSTVTSTVTSATSQAQPQGEGELQRAAGCRGSLALPQAATHIPRGRAVWTHRG